MSAQTTPLGFLPGDIDTRTHCMFIYSEKDETFVRSVVDYLSAGIEAGEMCVCALSAPTGDMIRERIRQLGMGSELKSGQLTIVDSSDVYLRNGRLDLTSAAQFWGEKNAFAKSKSAGLRAFGEVEPVFFNRTFRLKVLEYEALIGLNFSANIAMCGYRSGITRSFLLQVKSVHPFIANSKSIRRNQSFVNPRKFLGGFYRFRHVSKKYPAVRQSTDAVREDFEDIAGRTPLLVSEVEEMKEAIGEVFECLADRARRGPRPESFHVHVTFAPTKDRFIIVLWYHGEWPEATHPDLSSAGAPAQDVFLSVRRLADDVHAENLNGDTVVTLVKECSVLKE